MFELLKSDLRLKSIVFVLLVFTVLTLLSGCGSSGETKESTISISGFNLEYDGGVELKKLYLKNDDLDEITDLYEEVGENLKYRDSLLVAERYSQGLGVNAFAQDNLDVLEDQGLTLGKIKKTQVKIKKDSETFNSSLVEYEISEGLIEDIPVIYISQLFIPQGTTIVLISYITEDVSVRDNMSRALKNLRGD